MYKPLSVLGQHRQHDSILHNSAIYPALQMEYLLLVFRKWPETETYWLINRPGLPVSRNSPLIHNTPSDPILIPELLASLTETLTNYFVLLERHTSTNEPQNQTQPQDREANADPAPSTGCQEICHA
ncbi:hypothetical protein GB937_004197 [Aspergillus fischeri]|nr:hypothetical protein GB937_004197 [Aspergillus fischeri]